MKIIEKMTRKSQTSGSSGHNNDNFSNFNEYDGENYGRDILPYQFLYCIFIIWLM